MRRLRPNLRLVLREPITAGFLLGVSDQFLHADDGSERFEEADIIGFSAA